MSTLSDLTLRRALADPPLRESLLATLVMLVASAGLTLLLTWLWVLRQGLRTPHSGNLDCLIVCGYVLQEGAPSAVFRTRLHRAAAVARAQPSIGMMVAGGGRPSEAAVGRDWLVREAGIDVGRIQLEETSVDTFENLRHARGMLPTGGRLGIVTSRFHVARVMVYARHLGLDAVPIPAEARWRPTPANLVAGIREAGFLCWFLSGRFWARLARRKKLLERIA